MISDIEKEWTHENIQSFLVNELRKQYAAVKKLTEEYELKNRDARVAGVSYKERKALTDKVEAGMALLKEIEHKGQAVKNTRFTVKQLVNDPDDLEVIQRDGFPNFLRLSFMGGWGYVYLTV